MPIQSVISDVLKDHVQWQTDTVLKNNSQEIDKEKL
jgi:hypothetical protein